MFQRQEVEPGLSVAIDLDYIYSKENSNTATITASIGLVVEGTEHSGKTVNFSSNGAFVFNQNFVIPSISDSKKHVFSVALKSVEQIIVRNQLYTMNVIATRGTESQLVELSTELDDV